MPGSFAVNDTLTVFKHFSINSDISFHVNLIIMFFWQRLHKVVHVGAIYRPHGKKR